MRDQGASGAAAVESSRPKRNRLVVSRFDGRSAEWDSFVRAQTGWTHFHLYGWRTVIEREFGHECVYFVAREGTTGPIVAVLPLVRVKSLVFGHYLVSMPFLNYGGPLGSSDGIRALTDEATRLASLDHVKLLELRSRTELPIDLPVSHRKLTVLLDLKPDPDAMMKSLPAKLRSQVKRPMKEGIEVRFGREHLGAFFHVFAQHMRDLGTPALPRSFFETIADVFPDVVFAVAYHERIPVACGCGFQWNGEFEITWASALRAYNKMSPNMLVYWALMEQMIERGVTVFNFGRCSRDSGTHKFKMQWGSREETLWWYQRVAGGPSAESSTPSPDKGAFALAARVWQKLPLSVATALGPSIVRFIP
jgi:FemAB-related protein (PEP-CTERM system-associated)